MLIDMMLYDVVHNDVYFRNYNVESLLLLLLSLMS